MENLIKKLQEEVGISEEQALKAVSVIKGFMDKEGLDIDWGKFAKGKYEEYTDKAKNLFESFTDKAEDVIDKAKDEASKLFK